MIQDFFSSITGIIAELVVMFFMFIANTLASIIDPNAGGTYSGGNLTADLTYFDKFFTVIIDLFKPKGVTNNDYGITFSKWGNAMIIIAQSFVAVNIAFSLFKAFFGKLTESEEPFKIVFRGTIYAILVSAFYAIAGFVVSEIFSPLYKAFFESGKDTVQSTINTQIANLLGRYGASSVLVSMLPGSATIALTSLCLQLASSLIFIFFSGILLSKFFMLTIEVVERYIVVFLLLIFGPICVSFSANKATSQIASKYWSALFGGLFLLVMSVIFIYTFLLGFITFAQSFCGDKTLTAPLNNPAVCFILLYAWGRAGMQIDEYMQNLGFGVVRTGVTGADLISGLSSGGAVGAAMKMGETMGKMAHTAGAPVRGLAGVAAASGAVQNMAKNGNALAAFAVGAGAGGRNGTVRGGLKNAMGTVMNSATKSNKAAGKDLSNLLSAQASGGTGVITNSCKQAAAEALSQATGSDCQITSMKGNKDGTFDISARTADGKEFKCQMGSDSAQFAGSPSTSVVLGDGSTAAIKPVDGDKDIMNALAGGSNSSMGDVKNFEATAEENNSQAIGNENNLGVEEGATSAFVQQTDGSYAELAVQDGKLVPTQDGSGFMGVDQSSSISKDNLMKDDNGLVQTFGQQGNYMMGTSVNAPAGSAPILHEVKSTAMYSDSACTQPIDKTSWSGQTPAYVKGADGQGIQLASSGTIKENLATAAVTGAVMATAVGSPPNTATSTYTLTQNADGSYNTQTYTDAACTVKATADNPGQYIQTTSGVVQLPSTPVVNTSTYNMGYKSVNTTTAPIQGSSSNSAIENLSNMTTKSVTVNTQTGSVTQTKVSDYNINSTGKIVSGSGSNKEEFYSRGAAFAGTATSYDKSGNYTFPGAKGAIEVAAGSQAAKALSAYTTNMGSSTAAVAAQVGSIDTKTNTATFTNSDGSSRTVNLGSAEAKQMGVQVHDNGKGQSVAVMANAQNVTAQVQTVTDGNNMFKVDSIKSVDKMQYSSKDNSFKSNNTVYTPSSDGQPNHYDVTTTQANGQTIKTSAVLEGNVMKEYFKDQSNVIATKNAGDSQWTPQNNNTTIIENNKGEATAYVSAAVSENKNNLDVKNINSREVIYNNSVEIDKNVAKQCGDRNGAINQNIAENLSGLVKDNNSNIHKNNVPTAQDIRNTRNDDNSVVLEAKNGANIVLNVDE